MAEIPLIAKPQEVGLLGAQSLPLELAAVLDRHPYLGGGEARVIALLGAAWGEAQRLGWTESVLMNRLSLELRKYQRKYGRRLPPLGG